KLLRRSTGRISCIGSIRRHHNLYELKELRCIVWFLIANHLANCLTYRYRRALIFNNYKRNPINKEYDIRINMLITPLPLDFELFRHMKDVVIEVLPVDKTNIKGPAIPIDCEFLITSSKH